MWIYETTPVTTATAVIASPAVSLGQLARSQPVTGTTPRYFP